MGTRSVATICRWAMEKLSPTFRVSHDGNGPESDPRRNCQRLQCRKRALPSSFDRRIFLPHVPRNSAQAVLAFLSNAHDAASSIAVEQKSCEVAGSMRQGTGAAYHDAAHRTSSPDTERSARRTADHVATSRRHGIDNPTALVAHRTCPNPRGVLTRNGRAGRDGLPADAWMYTAASRGDTHSVAELRGRRTSQKAWRDKLDAMLCCVRTRAVARPAGVFERHPEPCGHCETLMTGRHGRH